MVWRIAVLTIFCLPKLTQSTGVEFDGFIDIELDELLSVSRELGNAVSVMRSTHDNQSATHNEATYVSDRNDNQSGTHNEATYVIDRNDNQSGTHNEATYVSDRNDDDDDESKYSDASNDATEKSSVTDTEILLQKVIKIKRLKNVTKKHWLARSKLALLGDNEDTVNFISSIYSTPIKVKDLNESNLFTVHVFRRALNTFEFVKNQMDDPEVKYLIDDIASVYKKQFITFIKDIQEQNVKTRIGPKKVVLNIIDTSNRILTRLVNSLRRKGLRQGRLSLNAYTVIKKRLDVDMNSEYRHVCQKFGVCRSTTDFSSYQVQYLTEVLKLSDDKLKQTYDALTEALKNTNFNIMDMMTQHKFRKGLEKIESLQPAQIRNLLLIFKSAIDFRNSPLPVFTDSSHLNKTVAFIDILDTLDKVTINNKEIAEKWQSLINDLKDYSENTQIQAKPVQDIAQKYIDVIKDGFSKIHGNERDSVGDKLAIIF